MRFLPPAGRDGGRPRQRVQQGGSRRARLRVWDVPGRVRPPDRTRRSLHHGVGRQPVHVGFRTPTSTGWTEAPGAVVVVDPIRTPTAARADLHLQLYPGSDGALAFALLHVLWRDDLIDRGFLEASHGRVGRVGAGSERDARRSGASGRPACRPPRSNAPRTSTGRGPSLLWLGQGFQRQRFGGNAMRAASLLPAEPVRVKEIKSAGATPICALAATRFCSASATSGRRTRSWAGKPGGTSGGEASCSGLAATLNNGAGRPQRIASACSWSARARSMSRCWARVAWSCAWA